MNIQKIKADLRTHSLARRNAIAPDMRIEKSLNATAHGIKHIEFDAGTIISGFFPIRSEIDPRPLMDEFRECGARLCLPVVMDKTTIIFRELVQGGELIDTGFGTRGPGGDAAVLEPELMLIPLSVFDHHGGRIGYGAGYYDRAIEKLKAGGIKPRLIGMAFDCQHEVHVPVEGHDQPLEAMLTESGYYRAKDI